MILFVNNFKQELDIIIFKKMKVIGNLNNAPTVKRFSSVSKNEKLVKKLMASSRSMTDVNSRLAAYSKGFSNLEELSNLRTRKHTSGLGDLSGLSANQFVNVTIATAMSSIVGFFAVERGMDATTMTLPFVNILNADDNSMVSPNIGPDTGLNSAKRTTNGGTGTSLSLGTSGDSLVPGTVNITLTVGANTYVIKDDANGNLVGPALAGLADPSSVDYTLGTITLTVGTPFDSYIAEWIEDHPSVAKNKVKPGLKYYEMRTNPEVLIQESNLIAELEAQKAMGIPMRDITRNRLFEEYVKMSNRKVVDAINLGYVGNTTTIDLSGYDISTSATFETALRAFVHNLNKVDTDLTDKSYKSVSPSAYLVGKRVAELFKSCSSLGMFVPNTESTYIEGLIGYFNGIPVIKSHRVGDWIGYASHKTYDGQMAPVAKGIFLPANDLPEVGNFDNPTQSATGLYSYEGTKLLTSELLQRFEVTVAAGGVL